MPSKSMCASANTVTMATPTWTAGAKLDFITAPDNYRYPNMLIISLYCICPLDIDECRQPPEENRCFGDCINTEGSFQCRCPIGTFGDPTVRGGCLKTANSSAEDALQLAAGMPPIGRPNCDTTCGDVQVPYPFGLGPSRCYLPGFELTCNASYKPPRLLLGNGSSSLQVVGIFLNDSTVRVIHTNTFPGPEQNYFGVVDFPDIGRPYMLSTRNEFILAGCNVEATLHDGTDDDNIISSCVSNCISGVAGNGTHSDNLYCHVHIPPGSKPKKVKFNNRNTTSPDRSFPPLAFIAEEGQIDQWYMIFNRSTANYNAMIKSHQAILKSTVSRHMASQVPLVLRWVVKQHISTSAQTDCRRENGSYICHCKEGFYGNPYIIGGCQDIDECKIPSKRNACFGDCKNLDGSHKCRCPQGTRGDPYKLGGCINILTGEPNRHNLISLQIGLLAASGPTLLLLVLGVCFALRKVQKRRIMLLRQKYFKQNRLRCDRWIEHTLEALKASKKYVEGNMSAEEFEEDNVLMYFPRQSMEQSSRRYSMEHEFAMSARYPR
ncbi:hypothetical protein EJB05_44046, partial [Eragrostis curvula]